MYYTTSCSCMTLLSTHICNHPVFLNLQFYIIRFNLKEATIKTVDGVWDLKENSCSYVKDKQAVLLNTQK